MDDLSLEKLAKRIAEAVLYYGDSRGYATRRIAKELAAAEERGRKAGLEEARRMANKRLEAWRLAPKSLGHSVNPTGLLELHRNDLIRQLKEPPCNSPT